MSVAEAWVCPSCNCAASTLFCPSCGERRLSPRELTIRGLIDQLVQAFINVDGRLIRTIHCLLSRPGFLTVGYMQGRRKPYVGPVSLFLSANVLFFATESLTGGRVFTTPLDAHLHSQPWSALANSLISTRVQAMGTTVELYAPVFDRAVAVNARLFVICMALSFAPLTAMVFHRSSRPLLAHAMFSFHTYAFLLLVFCVATVIPPVQQWFGGAGQASEPLDHAISISLLMVCAVYLYIATGVVYGASGAVRLLKVLTLTVGVAGIVLGYRFALLLITLYSS